MCIMDFRELFKDYVDPSTGLTYSPMPSHLMYPFHERVRHVGELLEEAERLRLRRVVNNQLKIKSSRKTDWVFLTVNFDPSKSFTECFKAAQKLGKRKIWEWSCWVHEQRMSTEGETSASENGHHIHLLAKIKQQTASAKTRAKSTVCTVCAVENSAIFNWKWIPEEYLADKYQYMVGSKALEKQAKQRVDKLWRERNSILSIYHNGPVPIEAFEAEAAKSAEAESI